jgi:hypothetical protein
MSQLVKDKNATKNQKLQLLRSLALAKEKETQAKGNFFLECKPLNIKSPQGIGR